MQDGHGIEVPGNLDAGPPAENPEVTNEFGIEETTDVVESLVKLANAVKVTMEDGKFTAMEAFNFTSALISLPSALTGIEMIPAELDNLDDGEIETLVNTVRETLEYASDELIQAIIKKALMIALEIKELVGIIKDA